MSLNWQIGDTEAFKDGSWLNEDGTMTVITNAIIWSTLAVDIGTITDQNLVEFAARVALVEKISGPFVRNGDGTDHPLTIEELRKHVGLGTNVTTRSFAEWSRLLMKQAHKDEVRRAEQRFARLDAVKTDEVA
jgi:hypothetical protein